MLGRFLELAFVTDDPGAGWSELQQLGFADAPSGDIWTHAYGVVACEGLAIGLHAAGDEPLTLNFVRPDLAALERELSTRLIDVESTRLGSDVFNELGLREPGGMLLRVIAARTFSPPLEIPRKTAFGRFLSISLPCADLGEAQGILGAPRHGRCGERRSLESIGVRGLPLAYHERGNFRNPLLLFDGIAAWDDDALRAAGVSIARPVPALRERKHRLLHGPGRTCDAAAGSRDIVSGRVRLTARLQRKDPRLPVYVVISADHLKSWALAGTTVVEGSANGVDFGRRNLKAWARAARTGSSNSPHRSANSPASWSTRKSRSNYSSRTIDAGGTGAHAFGQRTTRRRDHRPPARRACPHTRQLQEEPMSNPYNPYDSASSRSSGASLDHASITTAFDLPGHRVVRNLGLVRGITVRSRSIVGNFVGGPADAVRRQHHHLHEAVRAGTRRDLPGHAAARAAAGANAVIGVRYDATELMAGLTEVLCYGTAVVVEKDSQ